MSTVSSEYRELINGTNHSKQIVSYRNNIFNILAVKKPDSTIFQVPENTPYAHVLDKYIRILDEVAKCNSYVIFILNFCDDIHEAEYLLHHKPIENIPVLRRVDVNSFKEVNKVKFSFLNRMELMKDI